jgi:ABC-type transport system involved in multi-copper enzyme maturation permease subunit
MFTQLRLELARRLRSKSFYLSFITLVGFVSLMLWGFYSYAECKTGGQATEQFKYTYESKSYFNGLTFTLYSVTFSFSLLIPIFVTMTAGCQDARRTRASAGYLSSRKADLSPYRSHHD